MNIKQLFLPLVMVFIALVTGCTPDIAPQDYTTVQAGQAARTVRGTIISATPVRVSGAPGQTSGVGTLAGAAAGGLGGSAIGGGWRANALGAVGGALLGGLAGHYAENKLTQQTGMQYEVQQTDGSIVSVTQGANPILAVGQRVFVVYGSQTRVIPDTSSH